MSALADDLGSWEGDLVRCRLHAFHNRTSDDTLHRLPALRHVMRRGQMHRLQLLYCSSNLLMVLLLEELLGAVQYPVSLESRGHPHIVEVSSRW